jgi:hypothetical protein
LVIFPACSNKCDKLEFNLVPIQTTRDADRGPDAFPLVLCDGGQNVNCQLIGMGVIDGDEQPESMSVAMKARLRDSRSSLAMTKLRCVAHGRTRMIVFPLIRLVG